VFHGIAERFVWPRAVDDVAVHDEGRRPEPPLDRIERREVPLDDRLVRALVDRRGERAGVHAFDPFRVTQEILTPELRLIREEQVVIAPERLVARLPLHLDRGARRSLGVRVIAHRPVAPDHHHACAVVLEHALDRRHRARAVGALEIAERLDDDPRPLGTPPRRERQRHRQPMTALLPRPRVALRRAARSGGQRKRRRRACASEHHDRERGSEDLGHQPPSIRKSCASSMTATPSCCAFSSLLPASSPATTKSVFFDTEPLVFPPACLMRASASLRLSVGSVPVMTKVLPATPSTSSRFSSFDVSFTPAARRPSKISRIAGDASSPKIESALLRPRPSIAPVPFSGATVSIAFGSPAA